MNFIKSNLLPFRNLYSLSLHKINQCNVLTILLSLIIVTNSCVSYQASVVKTNQLDHGALKIDPEWKYKRTGKWIFPVMGLAAGGFYGYNDDDFIQPIENREQNAAVWGVAGLLGGAVVGGMLFPGRGNGTRDLKPSENQKWLRKYNSDNKSDYILLNKDPQNNLILIPKSLHNDLERIENEYEEVARTLKSNQPVTWDQLEDYRALTKNEYATFLPEQNTRVEQLISSRESEAAYQYLKRLLNAERSKAHSYSQLEEIAQFYSNYYNLYNKLADGQRKAIDENRAQLEEDVLTELLAAYSQSLSNINFSIDNLPDLIKLYGDFEMTYGKYKFYDVVKNFYSEYSNKKTSVISDNLKAITYEINSSKNVGELARLENLYLSNTKANTKIKQIKSLIDSKEANLLATERRNEMLRQKDKRRIIEEKLDGFKVNGLKFSQMFTDIYLGDFNDIPFSAEDKEVSALLYQYMLAYGTICKSNLPDDQVEIEELNCKHKQLITDANGYTTTNCLEYGWDGIGIYAKPDLYKAYRVIVATRSANDFYDFFDVFSNPNSYRQNLYDEASKIISIKSDIYELIRINKCSKKLLDKFEANLIAFIKDDASFLFDKDKVFEPGPNQEVDYTKQHNMEKFIDHLLAIEKKKWLIGYYPGSVKDVKVLTRDSKNRPNKIIAKYGYDMIIGKADYKVTLLLEDGIPTCLKFPTLTGSSCKTPYHKVVENFVNGMYIYEPSN